MIGTSVQPAGVEVLEFVSLEPQREDLARLSQNSAIAAAIAIAISIALGLLASRQVLLPLRRLGLAARRLGAGKLETRIEVRGTTRSPTSRARSTTPPRLWSARSPSCAPWRRPPGGSLWTCRTSCGRR